MVYPAYAIDMSQTTTAQVWTDSTDTQMHDLGTTLRGVGLLLGLALGLVLVVGYTELAALAAGVLLGLQ